MLLNGQEIITPNGGRAPLKDALLQMLDIGTGEPEDNVKCVRLWMKIDADDTAELDDNALALLKKCLPRWKPLPWPQISIEYHLWPGDMANRDREMVERKLSGS